ncbi:MAG: hypothetical protein QG567_354, partial [Campylobacterota bacterium]|nr:hypothetical protein [Campylobacterota bacterium]
MDIKLAASSKNEVLIIKRLEILKSMLELEDFDSVQLQADKLQAENVDGLSDIIKTCKNSVHQTEKIIKLIDDYIYQPKTIQLTQHQQIVYNQICQEFDAILSQRSL